MHVLTFVISFIITLIRVYSTICHNHFSTHSTPIIAFVFPYLILSFPVLLFQDF